MKHIYTILLALIFANAGAQIPDPNFDEWINGNPAGWLTSNDSIPGSVVRSDSGYNDTSAMEINVIALNDSGKNFGGYAYTANQGTGTPDPSVPLTLLGWYKLKSRGNDLGSVSVSVYSNGYVVGSGLTELPPQDTGYRQFFIDISYTGTFATIDYSNVNFQFVGPTLPDSLHAGTQLTVDNLAYGYNTSSGIPLVTESNGGIKLIYPNPSNGLSDIIYDVPGNAKVSLALFDVLGRQKKVMLNQQQARGEYKIQLNTKEFAEGVYFVRLYVNNESFNTPFIIN